MRRLTYHGPVCTSSKPYGSCLNFEGAFMLLTAFLHCLNPYFSSPRYWDPDCFSVYVHSTQELELRSYMGLLARISSTVRDLIKQFQVVLMGLSSGSEVVTNFSIMQAAYGSKEID